MIRPISLLFLYLVLFSGCQKISNTSLPSPVPLGTQKSVSLEIVEGSGQQDSVGLVLKQPIIVKISYANNEHPSFIFQMIRRGVCGADSSVQVKLKSVVGYKTLWRLNNNIGKQTLKFKVLDTLGNVIDSTEVTAIGLPPKKGWHRASCITPVNNAWYASCLVKASNGGIIAGQQGGRYSQYSDDNGVTWGALRGLVLNGNFVWPVKGVANTNNEVLLSAGLDGILYSNDGGSTWQPRGAYIPSLNSTQYASYLPDGKWISTTDGGGLYISSDKGLNWITIGAHAAINKKYRYCGALPNGDIYLTETNNVGTTVKKLDPLTYNISNVNDLPKITIDVFFIDNDGTRYIGGMDLVTKKGEIHRSKDGLSWTRVFSLSTQPFSPGIYNITKQSDGNYYFVFTGGLTNVYYKTTSFTTFHALPTAPEITDIEYVVAKNGYFIVNAAKANVLYYVP